MLRSIDPIFERINRAFSRARLRELASDADEGIA
jgi:hypothetical protein